MEIGWAIVGCSDIVEQRGAAAICSQAQSRLVAVHSRNKERADAFATTFSADYGTADLGAALADERIRAVYIATEVDRHRELTVAAANAGKHVLVEKPMALDVQECRTMVGAAERAGVHLAVAYYVRFYERSRIMKQVIEEGHLGQVVRAVVRNVGYYNPSEDDPKYWRVTKRGGGNCLADVGSHRLDLLCYLLGRPALVTGLADRLSMDYEACDTETALVRYENGAHVIAMANANVPNAGACSTSIEIYGTKGSLLTDPWNSDPIRVAGSDADFGAGKEPENRHFPMVDDFAGAIAEGRAPRFDGVDGMWATAIIAGAYDAARTGEAQPIAGV
jgi:predicted dehydrogenase